MDACADVLAVIPARGGSQRVPLKNIVPVAGRPCLCYAVDALHEAITPLRTVLLTDHPRIAHLGRELGLEVLHEPAELANDDHVDETVLLRLALDWAEQKYGRFSHVLLHYACVPIRPAGVVDQLIQVLRETQADFVQTVASVGPHHHAYRLIERSPTGTMSEFVPGTADIMSQDYPPLFVRTAAGVGITRDAVLASEAGRFFQPDRPLDRRCLVHAADDCVDLDEPRDILWAEFLWQRRQATTTHRSPAHVAMEMALTGQGA